MEKSKSLRLNLHDLKKIFRDFGLHMVGAAAAAGITLIPAFQQWALSVIQDNLMGAVVLVPVLTSVVNTAVVAIRKFLTDYTKH